MTEVAELAGFEAAPCEHRGLIATIEVAAE